MLEVDRVKGCLFGLAIGDAVGAPLEFKRPRTFTPISDMIGGGQFNLLPGQWTDDTSMALCLAESLVECRGFNSIDQLSRYLRWFKEGYMSSTGNCFDIGATTLEGLRRFEKSGQPYRDIIEGYGTNGSLMRLAPIPLFFSNDPTMVPYMSRSNSMTTHNVLESVDACRYFGTLILGAIKGISKEEILSKNFSYDKNYWVKEPLTMHIREVAEGSFKEKNPPTIWSSSNAAKSLEAALWAFYHSNSFKDGCLMAVNLGDDADTVGAIYGQLAGAFYGIQDIPTSWISKLWKRELIEDLSLRLFTYREHPRRD